LRLLRISLDQARGDGAQIEIIQAEIGLYRKSDTRVEGVDLQPVLRIGYIVVALGEAEEILLLQVLDVLEQLRVAEEGARLLEGQEVVAEAVDHLVGIAPRLLVDGGEIADILVA
jgi:hypothetical protein